MEICLLYFALLTLKILTVAEFIPGLFIMNTEIGFTIFKRNLLRKIRRKQNRIRVAFDSFKSTRLNAQTI